MVFAQVPVTVLAHVGVASVELWAGAVHPWLNLETGLALAAGTLWLAQRARVSDVQPFVVSAVALALGVAWGCGGVAPLPSAMGLLYALAVGAAVVLDVVPSLRVREVLVGLGALVLGAIAGADAAVDVKTPVLFVAGALSGGVSGSLAPGSPLRASACGAACSEVEGCGRTTRPRRR